MKRTKDSEIYSKVLALAIPMMIQNGISNAVSLVDNLMVGSLGLESMSGVSIVGQLIFVFNLAIFGVLSGPGIYGAQYFGQGNKKEFLNVVRLKIWACILICLVGLFIFITFDSNLIQFYLHGQDSNIDPILTQQHALEYLKIMLIGFVPFAITQVYAGSLRETGVSVLPMVAGISSVVVDIIFNYLLIYGKFGFPRLEVKGAAIATAFARIVEMSIVIIGVHCAKKKNEFLQGIYTTLKIPIRKMKKMIVKSLPIFFNEFMWAGGMAMLTSCYSQRGLSVIAGLNISNSLCNLLNVVFIAMGGAVGIIIGQYLGASEFEKAQSHSKKLMWFTGKLCLILTIILIGLSKYFPLLFEGDDIVYGYATHFIMINALFFPLQGFLNSLYFTLRSGGKTVITFLFDSVYTWAVPVVCAFLLCKFTMLPVLVIFAIVQSADIIKVIIGYILINRGAWINNLVTK